MQIKSKEIDIVPIESLSLHPKNANIHSDKQIDRLIELIKYQGYRQPLIVNRVNNVVVSGNCRLLALKKMDQKLVPVIYQDFDNEAQEYAYLVSDNEIARWAELDLDAVHMEIGSLDFDFDFDFLGIKNFSVFPENDEDEKTEEIKQDLNKKFILEITFPNDMEMMDIHDDLVPRGYIVKIK